MNRTPTTLNPDLVPCAVRPFLQGAQVFDSSCSEGARVWYLDSGYYLKRAPAGTLGKETALTGFFHGKGLAPEVAHYESGEWDWLLTCRAEGEDCIHPNYLADPKRLADTTGTILRALHETDPAGCPVPDHTTAYVAAAERGRQAGSFDPRLFARGWGLPTAAEAGRVMEEFSSALKRDTLLHGDYCLPNILLKDWRFSAFVDLDSGGVGDRHVDLFWGMWTLRYNLGTDRYCGRFLDAYGRDKIDPDLLRAIPAFEAFF